MARAARADETIVVTGTAPDSQARDRDKQLGDAPFVTVLHPDEHADTASVADAVATSVGAHVKSLGGLGAFESVSIRGAEPGQTEVLVDGVPLARLAAVTTDLGRFALGAFGEVDVYRGAVPVEYGGAGVGGALDLVTRLGAGDHGERFSASAGFGSFGARHVRAHYGDLHADGAIASSTTIGYQAAAGDFRYYDDHSTLLNTADDTYETRRNNGFTAVDADTRWGAGPAGTTPWAAGARLAYKQQGLPGSVADPASAANLSTIDVVLDGRMTNEIGAATARQLAYALVERQRLRDPDGELGLGAQHRDDDTLSGGASSTWHVPLWRTRLTIGAEVRADRFTDRDATGTAASTEGDREAVAPLAALDVPIGGLILTPAIRLDAMRTHPTPAPMGSLPGQTDYATRWDAIPSPRLSARYALLPDLALKTSAGWYVRMPTLVELFGDRGFIVGTPDLHPERGPSADLGAVWAPAAALGPVDRVLVQADAFATRSHDTIAFVTTAGYVARATNIGDTESYGGELSASARLAKLVSLTASYTRLETAQRSSDPSTDGKPIPRAPEDVLYARLAAAHPIAGHDAALWTDASVQSDSFLDPANHGRVPGRALFGAGASVVVAAAVRVTASVANLANTRVAYLMPSVPTALTDVAGFPLPGRSFYLSLDWTH
ncbi:MAG TPA: TonB-dependent receptor [Kofleriaceae bacterium]